MKEQLQSLREQVLSAFGEYLKAEEDFSTYGEMSHERFMRLMGAKGRWQQAEQEYYSLLHEYARQTSQ